jgi:uncharacterized membrane protein (DUF106 family)
LVSRLISEAYNPIVIVVIIIIIIIVIIVILEKWVPDHQGMERPQVADGGTFSSMEGSCEYIE